MFMRRIACGKWTWRGGSVRAAFGIIGDDHASVRQDVSHRRHQAIAEEIEKYILGISHARLEAYAAGVMRSSNRTRESIRSSSICCATIPNRGGRSTVS